MEDEEEEEPLRAKLLGLIIILSSWFRSSEERAAQLAAEEDGLGIVRESLEDVEFCLERAVGLVERKGEGGEGVEGVEGELDMGINPKSFRALRITEWRKASGPKANLIISFSPWSWIRRRPMIFEAFSGSKFVILENTILVASYESMAVGWC